MVLKYSCRISLTSVTTSVIARVVDWSVVRNIKKMSMTKSTSMSHCSAAAHPGNEKTPATFRGSWKAVQKGM